MNDATGGLELVGDVLLFCDIVSEVASVSQDILTAAPVAIDDVAAVVVPVVADVAEAVEVAGTVEVEVAEEEEAATLDKEEEVLEAEVEAESATALLEADAGADGEAADVDEAGAGVKLISKLHVAAARLTVVP